MSEKYAVGIQTVSDLIKNRYRILKCCSDADSMLGHKHRYTLKTSEYPKVDFATYEWFRQERFKETPISAKLTEIEILHELKLKFGSELQAKWLSKRQKCSIWSWLVGLV